MMPNQTTVLKVNPVGLLPLQIQNLSLIKGQRQLLKNINLNISSPGITTILGDNGAGKSLLVRVIHGLIDATQGQILWAGSAAGVKQRERQSLVFQRPVLLRRSVAENVQFVLNNHRRRSTQRCNDILQQAGLLDKATQSARLLSGGEQQRLALARALATDPEVLLLDEPTASLDPAATLKIENWLKQIADSGVKIFLVTHNIGQARRLSQDIVFMAAGTVEEYATGTEFFENPASQSARLFLDGLLVAETSTLST